MGDQVSTLGTATRGSSVMRGMSFDGMISTGRVGSLASDSSGCGSDGDGSADVGNDEDGENRLVLERERREAVLVTYTT